MDEAKSKMLKTIRKALDKVPENEAPKDVDVPRKYRQHGKLKEAELIDLFMERVGDYKATVKQVGKKELTDTITESCRKEEVEKLVVPDGFPPKWLPDAITALPDKENNELSFHQLDDSDGVITTCTLAIAQTGTIILNGDEGQGRRVLTLLPDYHICIVKANQIVELVAEGFAHFTSTIQKKASPITFISGPSATSDIELSRVEGVHGPRKFEIIICED